MDLGQLDTCVRVKAIAVSRSFYEGLGFDRVEGEDEEGWAVLARGSVRIGLFEPQFMTTPFSLNFRGGDVMKIGAELQAKGYIFQSGPTPGKAGGASASLLDPDGNMILFDSSPQEILNR